MTMRDPDWGVNWLRRRLREAWEAGYNQAGGGGDSYGSHDPEVEGSDAWNRERDLDALLDEIREDEERVAEAEWED